MLIDDRSVQRALAADGIYKDPIDGIFGPESRVALRTKASLVAPSFKQSWPDERCRIAVEQAMMKAAGFDPGELDGLVGSDTRLALEKWQDRSRDLEVPAAEISHLPSIFPRQQDMAAFYGKPGTGHTSLDLPYPMRIAWDLGKSVTRITIHEKCAESAGRAFEAVKARYGHERLKQLGLDLFGGCFNNRPMRGGTRLSTHAFAAAIDFDPEHNQLRWGRDRARMAQPDCAPFLDAWAAQGWVSLGRERNMDWMHLQAARL